MPSFVREESSGSVKVFWLEERELLEALTREAQRLGEENPEVEQIVLFGSLAQGRALPGSDADLLIVLARSDKPFLERIGEWLTRIRLGFPVDVFPYTRDELHVPLAKEALRTGIVLFARKRAQDGS
uniref:Nucleotidyltransferase domain-containing protein n=1 Tax=Candidatus Caldatribacterium saccharofermentans TaxID=1454753 RepID=A0A7V4TJJ9_9BACT